MVAYDWVECAVPAKLVFDLGDGDDNVGFSTDLDIPYEVYGGPGNDLLEGFSTWSTHLRQVLDGGAGDDTIDGDLGPDVVRGGPGNDRWTAAPATTWSRAATATTRCTATTSTRPVTTRSTAERASTTWSPTT